MGGPCRMSWGAPPICLLVEPRVFQPPPPPQTVSVPMCTLSLSSPPWATACLVSRSDVRPLVASSCRAVCFKRLCGGTWGLISVSPSIARLSPCLTHWVRGWRPRSPRRCPRYMLGLPTPDLFLSSPPIPTPHPRACTPLSFPPPPTTPCLGPAAAGVLLLRLLGFPQLRENPRPRLCRSALPTASQWCSQRRAPLHWHPLL